MTLASSAVQRGPTPTRTLAAEQAVEVRRSQTLVTICHAEIERMILDAELEMGSRVNEVELAARLGISRGPVREACRGLVQSGLLETHANRGFFVRKLAHKEVVDLYDLRAGLMAMAGKLVAEKATAEDIAALRDLIRGMDAACAAGDTARFQALNAEFHGALVTATDNRRLQDIYTGLVKELKLFRRRGLVSATAITSANREHHAILEAIESRNGAHAAAAMEQHILEGKARFLAAAVDELEC